MPPQQMPSKPANRLRPHPSGRQQFCLLGFWGVPNFGDEWLLRSAQNILRDAFPDCGIAALVLSVDTERRLGEHAPGVRLVDGFFPEPSFFLHFPAIVAAIGGSDVMLIGGGGLINDTYTSMSIPRYAVPALLAMAMGKPVVWWGLGVVPPRNRALRHLALWTLRHSAALLVRDRLSRSYLERHAIASRPCLDLSALDPATLTMRASAEASVSERMLIVNFRDAVPELTAGRTRFLASQLDRFERIVLLAAEPCDELLYQDLIERLVSVRPEAAATLELVPAAAYAKLRERIAAATVVVSERLHVSLYALSLGTPTVVLSYEDKIDEIIGAMYPAVPIVPRAAFWSKPHRDDFQIPGRPAAADPACGATVAAVVETVRAAGGYRLPAVDRLGAVCWLVALLPAGAAVAALKQAKRLGLMFLSRWRAGSSALEPADAVDVAAPAEGPQERAALSRRRSVTVLH